MTKCLKEAQNLWILQHAESKKELTAELPHPTQIMISETTQIHSLITSQLHIQCTDFFRASFSLCPEMVSLISVPPKKRVSGALQTSMTLWGFATFIQICLSCTGFPSTRDEPYSRTICREILRVVLPLIENTTTILWLKSGVGAN
jgi:hypothetical protein